MTSETRRTVTVERTAQGRYLARNVRGGVLEFGSDAGELFTPVELMLAALAGCTAVDVDAVTSRRAEPAEFAVRTDAEKVRDGDGNHLVDVSVTYRLRFPDGREGDAARAVLEDAVRMSHDRLCTVGRTMELGTPIATRFE